MIYRIRVILDASVDCFRDIEIAGSDTLEDFHNVIAQSFQLPGDEMASFYSSDDDWNQDEEYCLFDMSEGTLSSTMMRDTTIEAAISKEKNRMIFIYDFLKMWTFLVELAETVVPASGVSYPQVVFAIGKLPDNAPDREFEADPRFSADDGDDDFFDEQHFEDHDIY